MGQWDESAIRRLIHNYFRAVNDEDFVTLFALFDNDVRFSAPFGFQAKGLAELKPYYQQISTLYPEHVDTPERVVVDGNRVAVLIDFVGVNKKGDPVRYQATDWFEIEEGKIRSLSVFFDSYHLYRQGKGA